MKESPKISMIIPVYNAEDFIERAYSFINRQTVKLPLEIIFVDNNSVDSSLQILNKIAATDSRVKVFQESKQGVAPARNKGFKESTGSFVHFFDVDDELFEEGLKALSDVLIADDSIAAAFGKMYKTDKTLSEINVKDLEQTGDLVIKQPPYWGLKWLNDLSSVVGSATFLYRREVFEELGLYDERLKWNEDTAIDIGLGMDYKIAYVDKYIYLYIKHGESWTDGLKKKMNRAFLQWSRYILTHIPYAINNPHQKEFHNIVRKNVFHLMGKMIYTTPTLKARKALLKNTQNEILPWILPTSILLYMKLLVYWPNESLSKFYHYYYLNSMMK